MTMYLTGSYQIGDFLFVIIGGENLVKINGEYFDIAGKTLEEYLKDTNYVIKRIAIERNGDIVPKAQYGEVILNDGDEIEVVSFVGGG